MRLGRLRRLVDRAAGEVTAIARQDAPAPREVVAEFEGIVRGTLAGLEHALAERGAAPTTPISGDWAEPTIGALVEFFRGELAALNGFDLDDIGTASLIEVWLRTYSALRDALIEGTGQTELPCPTEWLELQCYRLAWQGPGRNSDTAACNRLNVLLGERRDHFDPLQ